MVQAVSQGEGTEPSWSLRAATSEDGGALCELVSTERAGARRHDAEVREPDFFALRRIQSQAARTWVVTDATGGLAGCGTLTVRDAWVRGQTMKLGRLSDLRLKSALRGGTVFPEVFGRVLEVSQEDFGVEIFAGLVPEQDLPTLAALMHRTAHRRVQPRAQAITAMHEVTVALRGLGGRPEREVTRATASDLDALAAFLGPQRQSRLFGHVLSAESLHGEISRWAGLRVEDFYVARDGDRIVGCVAPWDPSPVRRWVYSPEATGRAALALKNAIFRGHVPRPPAAGSPWRRLELTHLEVDGDDPSVLRDLLTAVGEDPPVADATHLSLHVPRDHKLGRALEGLRAHVTPVALMIFCPPGSRWCNVDFRTQRPGLEPALW